MMRLLSFAIISHFAFNFAFGLDYIPFKTSIFNQTSVIWSLFIAAGLIYILKTYNLSVGKKVIIIIIANLLSFPSDWSCIAVMIPFFLYEHRVDLKKQALDYIIFAIIYASVYFIFIDKVYAIIQLFICLSIPILSLYNGKAGKNKSLKWGFYIYYPAHLVIIGILRLLLYGNINILF